MPHEQRILSHPRLTVTIFDGTEGPDHDLHYVVEYIAQTQRGVTVYHHGKTDWVSHNGHRIEMVNFGNPDMHRQWIEKVMFPELVGFTPSQLHRMFQKRIKRCRYCGRREFARAYLAPVTLMYCQRCGEVATSFKSMDCITP